MNKRKIPYKKILKIAFLTILGLNIILVITFFVINQTMIIFPWYFQKLNISELQKETTGRSINVAIIDSGFDSRAAEYLNNFADFYDATEEKKTNPVDGTGHGTQMALLIAANSQKRNSIYGIAPDVNIYAIKTGNQLGVTKGTYLHEALTYCLNKDIDIVNISLGGTSTNDLIKDDVKKLKEQGTFVICAAGDTSDVFLYPADYEDAYCIQTQNQDASLNENSNNHSHQDKVGIKSPGTDIDVLVFNGVDEKILYQRTGSSFATAIFSGYLALALAGNSKIHEPKDLDIQLKSGTIYNENNIIDLFM